MGKHALVSVLTVIAKGLATWRLPGGSSAVVWPTAQGFLVELSGHLD
jgi:hypothetical protein